MKRRTGRASRWRALALLVFCSLAAVGSEALADDRKGRATVALDRGVADRIDPELWPTLEELLARSHLGLVPGAFCQTAPKGSGSAAASDRPSEDREMLKHFAVDSDGSSRGSKAREADGVFDKRHPGGDTSASVAVRVTLDAEAQGVTVQVGRADVATADVTRRVDRAESAVIFVETLAHVIASAAQSVARLTSERPSRDEFTPRVARSAAVSEQVGSRSESAPRSIGTGLLLGARGGASWIAQGAPRPVFGAMLGARWATREATLTLEGQGAYPESAQRENRVVQLGAGQLRLTATALAWRLGRAAFDLGGTAGIDLLSFRLRGDGTQPASVPSRRVQPVVGPRAGVRVDLARGVALLVGAGLDIDLAPRKWVIRRMGRTTDGIDTGRLRAQALGAVEWTFARVGRDPREEPER